MCGMYFALGRCKVLLQDLQDPELSLTLDSGKIKVIDEFVYLSSCLNGGNVSDEINSHIMKTRADHANLGQLWRLRDANLDLRFVCESSLALRLRVMA